MLQLQQKPVSKAWRTNAHKHVEQFWGYWVTQPDFSSNIRTSSFAFLQWLVLQFHFFKLTNCIRKKLACSVITLYKKFLESIQVYYFPLYQQWTRTSVFWPIAYFPSNIFALFIPSLTGGQYFLHIKREIWLICERHAIPFPQDNAKQAIMWLNIDLWQSITSIFI